MAKRRSITSPFGKAFNDLITREYQIHQWWYWFLQDCLAPWRPIKPEALPPEDVLSVLFQIGREYAKQVIASDPFEDILGETYMDLSSHYQAKHMGQYFTPWDMALMMARFNQVKLVDQPLIRIGDLGGCGSGNLILAVAHDVFMNQGPEALLRCSFTGVDLDRACSLMTALQFVANMQVLEIQVGELLVYHGNALGPVQDLDVVWHTVHNTVPAEEVIHAHDPRREAVYRQDKLPSGSQLDLL